MHFSFCILEGILCFMAILCISLAWTGVACVLFFWARNAQLCLRHNGYKTLLPFSLVVLLTLFDSGSDI